MNKPLYKQFASATDARLNCLRSENPFAESWQEMIEFLVTNCLPHGSGIDNGVTFDFERSTGSKLVFHFGFHFMDDSGYYDGWENYTLIVTASMISNFDMRITGKNRGDIKEYLYQVFEYSLSESVTVDYDKQADKFILVQA